MTTSPFPKVRLRAVRLAGAFAIALSALVVGAQPSGGPYGPVHRTYSVPADANHVLYVAPDGSAGADGFSLAQPTSLAAAIERAVTGDVLVLRGGVYRVGGLLLNQGITIQPYADEQPTIKGTEVAADWTDLRNGLWKTKWTKLFPQRPADWWWRDHAGKSTPLHRFNNDMVFVDGVPLQSAGWMGELDANTFYIDYENGQVYIARDPAGHLVEITAHDGGLTRVTGEVHGRKSDGKGFTLRGLTFTQFAYRALEVEGREPDRLMDPSTFGKEVVGTTIEDCTITHCSRVAGYFRGDHFTMRNCLIRDTSTEGVYLIGSADSLLENNIFARNNVENIAGYFPSAVKIFNQSYRVTCRNNLVYGNPNSNGIWYDVGNVDAVFVNNWIQDCTDGFFFEISKRAICAGNVFVNCEKGVRALNSSGVRVYHNTFVNTGAAFERNERSAVGDHFGWHPSTGPDVDERVDHEFMGNLLVADAALPAPFYGYRIADTSSRYTPMVVFGQPQKMAERLTMSHVKAFDGNVYVRSGTAVDAPVISWSPSTVEKTQVEYAKLSAFQAAQPGFEAHSLEFYELPSFAIHSLQLKNYELVPGFSAKVPAETLPEEVRTLLGWAPEAATSPGAYPAKR